MSGKDGRIDVAVVSSKDLADLGPDDRLLVSALRDLGLAAEPIAWRGTDIDWSRVGVTVIRSTWDYSQHYEDFLSWVDDVSARSVLCNRAEVVRWNADKRYLRDLEEKGLPVVATEWLVRGSDASLLEVMGRRGWESAIFKPVVSAGARDTHLIHAADSGALPVEFARLLATRDMMVQPYMERIASDGEISLTFIEGEYSHSVVKHPGVGDYRVQEERGGSLRGCDVDAETIALGRRIVERAADDLLYARVDLVPDGDGQPRLMELELIEPELFLRFEPSSVTALARAVATLAGA